MKTIEEKIDRELKRHGLIREMLTDEELKQLRVEIELDEKGIPYLDGVLSNPELYYTRYFEYYRSRGMEVPPPSEDDYNVDEDDDDE